MNEQKNLFNPDFHKYGFSEYDLRTPDAPQKEPVAADRPAPADDRTAVSRLKALLHKNK